MAVAATVVVIPFPVAVIIVAVLVIAVIVVVTAQPALDFGGEARAGLVTFQFLVEVDLDDHAQLEAAVVPLEFRVRSDLELLAADLPRAQEFIGERLKLAVEFAAHPVGIARIVGCAVVAGRAAAIGVLGLQLQRPVLAVNHHVLHLDAGVRLEGTVVGLEPRLLVGDVHDVIDEPFAELAAHGHAVDQSVGPLGVVHHAVVGFPVVGQCRAADQQQREQQRHTGDQPSKPAIS